MARRSKRLVPKARSGLINRHAPFWLGDTAEGVLQRRLEERLREQKAKRARRGKRSARVTTPQRELRRLERNLQRRKTAEARARIAQRIKALRRELSR